MLYFTIGPVQMSEAVARAGGMQAPYFRDDDFAAQVMTAQNELLSIVKAPPNSKIAILSGSGTAAMEASVINFTKMGDRLAVVNGGSFGQRFVDISDRYGREVLNYKSECGRDLDIEDLANAIGRHRPAATLMNIHETSTGQLYDVNAVAKICKSNNALLICDAVSAIGADPLDMARSGIDILVFSSNKGLALAPGAAFVVASPAALERMGCSESFYLDLAPYFAGSDRGQPPVTSSIGVLQQLFARLIEIRDIGGLQALLNNVERNAQAFRKGLADLEIESFPQTPSNAITAFILRSGSSTELYNFLKARHEIIINKSAWGLNLDVPRISHVGALTVDDHARLLSGIKDYLQCT